MGGYSEMRINERTFEVQFQGNGFTSRQRARSGALYRAAELANQYGFFGFWVQSDDSTLDTTSPIFTPPVQCSTSGTLHGNTYDGTTTCSDGSAPPIRKPRASITVVMVTYPEAPKAPPGITVYDARLLLSLPPQ